MNDQNFTLTIEERVINKLKPNYGLAILLKKSMSCCSTLIEPKVEIYPISMLQDMEQEEKVLIIQDTPCTVALEKEVYSIYPQHRDLEITLDGLLIKKPKINLPAEIIQREKCTK